jgi:hypothetical protein
MDGKNCFIKQGLKMANTISDQLFFNEYSLRLQDVLAKSDWSPVVQLAEDLQLCLKENRRLFILNARCVHKHLEYRVQKYILYSPCLLLYN